VSKLVTEEMVDRAWKTWSESNLRFALEEFAGGIVEACARELDECAKRGAYAHGAASVVRSLKTTP
jgi:hypothetical protein